MGFGRGDTTIPRNGSGVYSKAAGTTATPNTTIRSAQFNQTIDDLVVDANNPRPVVAGGTGSGTVIGAQSNLSLDNKVVYATKATAYTALLADNNTAIRFTAAATLSLTPAATLAANWHTTIIANGGRVTVDPNASETINGASSLIIEDGQSAFIICDGSNFFASVFGAAKSGVGTRGAIIGLTLINNAVDITNDIDIGGGSAASDTSPFFIMELTSGITKRLDAAWAVGSGNGGLDTGSITDTTYHVFLIQRSDTGVVDALFSASATSPTMPTNYDRKRRIGSIVRGSGAILPFVQHGDLFQWVTPITDRSSTAAGGPTPLQVSVPFGLIVRPIIYQSQVQGTAGAAVTGFASSGSTVVTNIVATAAASERSISVIDTLTTDTSRQILINVTITSGTLLANTTITRGWFDRRGQDGDA